MMRPLSSFFYKASVGMVKGSVASKDSDNILEPIDLDQGLLHQAASESLVDEQSNLVFSHDFITSELSESGISSNQCSNCDPFIKYLVNKESMLSIGIILFGSNPLLPI